LAAGIDVSLIEDVLQFIGVFVSFSIAYVSFRGLRQTSSPALLRLATAFAFLGVGFMVQALVGLNGVFPVLPALTTTVVASLVVASALMETAGYFFLAFSHALDVMFSKRLQASLLLFPVFTLSAAQTTDALSILSFYFILYGVVETLTAYARTRKPDTFLIALGLALLGAGTFVPWLSLMYPLLSVLSLVQIIVKEIGLMILFIPVLSYALGGARANGPI
jgi:hypothetical protein